MTTYHAGDPEFTAIGPGLNAWNMRSKSWLDESRVWTASGNAGDSTITLRPHVRRDLPGLLAAELDIYLIEFRVPKGWDAGIPRAAVLIHRFEGGQSYLMHGNSGSPDLVAGDSFGDPDPGPNPISPFSKFERVDVLSIDAGQNEATLRIRHYWPSSRTAGERAIDPMAMILHGDAYLKWVEAHHPHEPSLNEIRAVLQAMTKQERDAARDRANTLARYSRLVEEAGV